MFKSLSPCVALRTAGIMYLRGSFNRNMTFSDSSKMEPDGILGIPRIFL